MEDAPSPLSTTPSLRLAVTLLAAAAAAPGPAAGQAVDTVTAADPPAGARLQTGSDTLQASMVRDSVRIPLGTLVETVRRTSTREGPGFLLVEEKALPSGRIVDSLTLRAGTLAPVRHVSRESSGDRAEVLYAGRGVEVRSDTAGGPAGSFRRRLRHAPFDLAQVRSLARSLPLEAGYVARVAAFDPWERDLRWVEVRVTGTETVPRPGGPVEAWRVRAAVGRTWSAVYLVARRSREELGLEVRDAAGALLWEARPR